MKNDLILIAGAGGFIGGHLVANLRAEGYTRIRAVDLKPPSHWEQRFDGVENLQLDLRLRKSCQQACEDVSLVVNLACDMGGMGF